MIANRLISIAAALVLSAVGLPLLFTGGVGVYRTASLFGGGSPFNPGPILLLLLGLVLLGAVAATIAISSAGAIVVGSLHVVWGLLVVLLPFDPMGGFSSPFMQFMMAIRGPAPALSDGLFFFVSTGFGLLVGAILLAAGVAARARRAGTSPLARSVSAIAAIIGLFAGLLLGLLGGAMIYRAQLQYLSGTVEVVGVTLVLLGVVLVAVAALGVRWSSFGAILAGGVVAVLGIIAVLQPVFLAAAMRPISAELALGLQIAAPVGNVALVGVVLAGAGVGAKLRSRRASAVQAQPIGEPAPGVGVYDN